MFSNDLMGRVGFFGLLINISCQTQLHELSGMTAAILKEFDIELTFYILFWKHLCELASFLTYEGCRNES